MFFCSRCNGWVTIASRSIVVVTFAETNKEKTIWTRDLIQGSVEQAKGKVKEIAGKVTGDAKLETEGKTQQTVGKIQNAVGGLKDTLKEAAKD